MTESLARLSPCSVFAPSAALFVLNAASSTPLRSITCGHQMQSVLFESVVKVRPCLSLNSRRRNITIYLSKNAWFNSASGKLTQIMQKLFRVILPVSNIERAAFFYAEVFQSPGQRVSPGRHYFDCGGTILVCYELADLIGDGERT